MTTGISWTDETWNPTVGCSKISQGCKNCYAIGQAYRNNAMGQRLTNPGRLAYYDGLTEKKGSRTEWTGTVNFVPEALEIPLKWKKPRRIFVNSMSDLFHESVPFEQLDQIFAVMALTPQHTYQCLSKRPDRMLEYCQSNPLPRIAALLYNDMYEQRANSYFQRAFRDRFPRLDLANCQAARQRGQDGGRVSHRSVDQPLQESEGRISAAPGVFTGSCGDRWQSDSDRCAPNGVASLQWNDSPRVDDQSPEWDKKRQPTREPGASDVLSQSNSCTRSFGCEPSSATGQQTPKNQVNGIGRAGDSETSSEWNDDQGHCTAVPNEPQSDFSYLRPNDLEARLTWPLPNVWIGVTIENQKAADERISLLAQTPAALRFLSCEPLLEDVKVPHMESLDWLICGGESGHGARDCNIDHLNSIVEQCRAAKVPVFVKQLGAHPFSLDEAETTDYPAIEWPISDKKGAIVSEWPEYLQVQEFPTT